jgi:hypothetical protein
VQSAPPFAGAGLLHVRVCVPPLPSAVQATLHAVQSLRPPSTGHRTPVLQVCIIAPLHAAPPFAGDGLVQVRVCVPPVPSAVQLTLHAVQSLQPPSTGLGVCAQTFGLAVSQLKPASSAQARLHPSPLRVLPSSHASVPPRVPSPQAFATSMPASAAGVGGVVAGAAPPRHKPNKHNPLQPGQVNDSPGVVPAAGAVVMAPGKPAAPPVPVPRPTAVGSCPASTRAAGASTPAPGPAPATPPPEMICPPMPGTV